MILTGIYIIHIFTLNIYLAYSSEFTRFQRKVDRDGRSCLGSDITVNPVDGLVFGDCLALCANRSDCTSVFYEEGARKCIGCGINYGSPVSLPTYAGTRGYAKEASYEDKCGTDVDCPLPHMGCYDEKCKCVPGYPYDPSVEECVDRCEVYGSTYQVFWLAELTSTPVEIDADCGVHFNLNPVECKDYCTAQSWCKSFDHSAPLCTCKYHSDTVLTKPANWWTILTPYFHYQRNCQ